MAFAATTIPDPQTIRHTAQEVLSRPEYDLAPLPEDGLVWYQFVWSIIKWVLTPILKLFNSLWDISPALAWVVMVGLIVILILLLWHITYSLATMFSAKALDRLTDPERKRIALSPKQLEDRAHQAADQRDYIAAVRFLFQACLLRLELMQKQNLRRGSTNREYLRRYQGSPVASCLQPFVEIIDAKWYGFEPCEAADFETCLAMHQKLCAVTREGVHAHGA